MSKDLFIEKFEFVPGRVDAAMQYVRHCQNLTDPDGCCGTSRPGRELSAPEQAAYLAALDALRMYFTAEMDFGGPPPRLPEAKGGATRDGDAHDGAKPKKSKKRKKDRED